MSPLLRIARRGFCQLHGNQVAGRQSAENQLVSQEARKRSEVLQLLHAKTKTEQEDVLALQRILQSDSPVFNKAQYLKAGDPAFVEHLRQEDLTEKYFSPRNRYIPKEALHFWKAPVLILAGGLFVFWLYQTVPAKVLLRHTTLNEHVYQQQHYHSILLHGINFGKDPLQLMLYFPALLIALFQTSKFFRGPQILGAMGANCLLSAIVHFYDQKVYREEKFMRTLPGGAANTLFFLCLPLAANPSFLIYKSIPYAVFPLAYLANEYLHFKVSSSEDIRVTHLSSMLNGLLLGALLSKRLFLKV